MILLYRTLKNHSENDFILKIKDKDKIFFIFHCKMMTKKTLATFEGKILL